MIHDVQGIAAEVIRKTGRDQPADAALREVLKQIKDLAPFDATEIAQKVFLYYRWHVWLREERGVENKMRLAIRLNQNFQVNPASIPLAELRAKAVPAWTAAEMDVTDEWLLSLQCEPQLWLRAKRGTGDALAKTLFAADVNPWLPEALLYRGEEDFTRANLRFRTSRHNGSGCFATPSRARRGGIPARAKAARRCTCPI